MSQIIHTTAIIADGARMGRNCRVGPFAVIESGVELGNNVSIGAHAQLLGNVRIGDDVEIHGTAIIGGPAQVKGYTPDGTEGVTIGARTIIREAATVNAGHHPHGGITRIGQDCYLMIQTHIAHDCTIGDRVVFANTGMVAGHVEIDDDVWVGGGAMVHQFQKIGKQAILGGGAIVVADVPPFCVGKGDPFHLSGINVRGLKRRNFSKQEMQNLRQAYRTIFRNSKNQFRERLTEVENIFPDDKNIADLLNFIRQTRKRPLAMAQ